MKTLIAYYSFSHNNETLANYLADQVGCELLKIETVKSRNGFSIFLDLMFGRKPAIKPISKSLEDYDNIICIAPIWAGKIATPMVSFLRQEKSNIRSYSFVTLCGGIAGQKEKIELELTNMMGTKPLALLELWVNKLLAADQKNKISSTTSYRITTDGLKAFDVDIQTFLREHDPAHAI